MADIIQSCIRYQPPEAFRNESHLSVHLICMDGLLIKNSWCTPRNEVKAITTFIRFRQWAATKYALQMLPALMMDRNTVPTENTFISIRCVVERCKYGV